ncbi:MAG: hypothetical protein HUK25_05635 [Treponema sp.]|nr:hypothetical protein [Treponema sp.]
MKKVLSFFAAAVMAVSAFALDFSFNLNPGVIILSGNCTETLKGPAVGADVGFNFHFMDMFTVGPEFGVDYIIKDGQPSYVLDFAPGVNVGAYWYPFGRIGFGVNAAAGIHFASYDYAGEVSSSGSGYATGREAGKLNVCNPFVRIEGNANYRLTSNLALGARAGYTVNFFDGHDFDNGFSPFMSGIDVGIMFRYTFSSEKPEMHVEASIEQDAPIYPLYMNVYKDAEFGIVAVKNAEDAEIKNVKVYFKASPYTASNYLCGSVKKIRKGQVCNIPLKGDFSKELSKFADDGSFPGEITITYELMGTKMTTTASVLVSTYNRNAMCWVDPSSLAAFISPSDETILDLSKFAGAEAKANLRSGLSSNLQTAIYMTEFFNSLGISRVTDKATPYAQSHLDYENNDYIQYPFQTLTYMTGDSDELGIVFASLLEAVSVGAVLIPLENDFIVGANLALTEKGASAIFDDIDQLLLLNDSYYLPLSMNTIGKGFNASWKEAVKQINAGIETGDIECVIVEDAWEVYPPLGLSGKRNIVKPTAQALSAKAKKELDTFTAENLKPKIKAYETLVSSGNATDEDKNALGLLYVRCADYKSAVTTFKPMAEKENISSMNNLANVYMLMKDSASAKKWYEKVLEINKDNKTAQKGLERIANEK